MRRALPMPVRLSLSGLFGGDSEHNAAARLAAAVALGLLFAVSLTLFGGPIAHTLKDLQAEPVSTSRDLPLRQ